MAFQPLKMEKFLNRAAKDLAFRRNFIANPETILKSEGVTLPAGVSIKVVEDTPTQAHLILPPFRDSGAASDANPESINGGYSRTSH